VTEGQTASEFNASIDRARSDGTWAIFLFHSIRPTSNDWYAGVDITEIEASVEHVKSLGNVWVDTMGEIGTYVRALEMFEALTMNGGTWEWELPQHFPRGKVLRVEVDGGTLRQGGEKLAWDAHGYYEVSLDAGTLGWSPE
jgi:hypothetical protein